MALTTVTGARSEGLMGVGRDLIQTGGKGNLCEERACSGSQPNKVHDMHDEDKSNYVKRPGTRSLPAGNKAKLTEKLNHQASDRIYWDRGGP